MKTRFGLRKNSLGLISIKFIQKEPTIGFELLQAKPKKYFYTSWWERCKRGNLREKLFDDFKSFENRKLLDRKSHWKPEKKILSTKLKVETVVSDEEALDEIFSANRFWISKESKDFNENFFCIESSTLKLRRDGH